MKKEPKKLFRDMSVAEAIDAALRGRGLNPKNQKNRKEYSPELIKSAQAGNIRSLNELLRIGKHFRLIVS
jgi:hypothetical protein